MIALHPPSRLDTSTYNSLIQHIKNLKSNFYLLQVPILLPYSRRPTPFILEVSEDTLGSKIEIINNKKSLLVVVPIALQTVIELPLEQGYNRISLRSNYGEHFELFVGATNFAAVLQGIGQEFFNNIQVNLQALEWAIRSPWSPKAVEHLLPWREDLPTTTAMRAQGARMSVRAAINEAGTDRGVTDFLASLSSQTPIAVRLHNDPNLYDPITNPLYSTPSEFAGAEFHLWISNHCMTTWETMPKLASNVSVYRLIDVRDEQIRFSYQCRDENHTFEIGSYECSLANAIELLGCMYNIWSWVKLDLTMSWASCAYWYPLDVQVESPLGMRTFDMGLPLDSVGYETEGVMYPSGVAQQSPGGVGLLRENLFIGDRFELGGLTPLPPPVASVRKVLDSGVLVGSHSSIVTPEDLFLDDVDFSVSEVATSSIGGFAVLGPPNTPFLLNGLSERVGFPKSDGDCNTTPGILVSLTTNFEGWIGKWITIDGSLRQITYSTVNSCTYSGAAIAGIGLTFTVWDEHFLRGYVFDDNTILYDTPFVKRAEVILNGDPMVGTNRQIWCRLWQHTWQTFRTLDTIDPHDPLGEGWLGLDLVRRNDSSRTIGPLIVGFGDGGKTYYSGEFSESPIGPNTLRLLLAGKFWGVDDPTSNTYIGPGWGDIRNVVTGVVFGAIEYATGRWTLNTITQMILPAGSTLAIEYIKSPAYCYDTELTPTSSLYSAQAACEADPIFCGNVSQGISNLSGSDFIQYCPTMTVSGKEIDSTQVDASCQVPCCVGPHCTSYAEGLCQGEVALGYPAGIGLIP